MLIKFHFYGKQFEYYRMYFQRIVVIETANYSTFLGRFWNQRRTFSEYTKKKSITLTVERNRTFPANVTGKRISVVSQTWPEIITEEYKRGLRRVWSLLALSSASVLCLNRNGLKGVVCPPAVIWTYLGLQGGSTPRLHSGKRLSTT